MESNRPRKSARACDVLGDPEVELDWVARHELS